SRTARSRSSSGYLRGAGTARGSPSGQDHKPGFRDSTNPGSAQDPALEFHSLRRSYITHLIEDGHDPLFVQQQVGHDHASTTAIYTCVSSDFRTRSLRRVLDATVEAALRPGRTS
ncbi:tyrosine-type recombinase/integrase, partial [Streptomyces sp. G35A]